MIGALFSDKEWRELNYLLRRELDEMLLDLTDQRMGNEARELIDSRYRVIFRMYARIATPQQLSRYVRNSYVKPTLNK